MEKKQIALLKRQNSYKITIPEEVESKIRFVCQKIWKDEWSGTLFYKPEGSFEDGTLNIRCVDIYIMDIGSAAYTEFDMSPDVISYMTENPELLDCQMGLIHSHNQMATFFSGTDVNTLKEEGFDRNHFVSLIVNNEGTYTAAITRKVNTTETVTSEYTYNTFNDETIKGVENYTTNDEYLEYFPLNIIFEKSNSYTEGLNERLLELKKAKEDRIKGRNIYTNSRGYASYTSTPTKYFEKTLEEDIKKHNNNSKELEFEFEDITDGYIPYGRITFNKKIIKSLVLQLITGSIILPNESKIDVNKWAQGMVPLYENRFGKGVEGLKLFKAWAEPYIEFICCYSEDEELIQQGLTDDELSAICAYDIIRELERLPQNEYIKTYIKCLGHYII
jgi:proteasome lid subunit RPN8/RPN11